MRVTHILVAALVGFFAGLMGSILGLGGGFLMVPVFVGILAIEPHTAAATSTMVITFLAGAAAVKYGFNRQIDYSVALWAIVPAVIGGVLGAMVQQHIPKDLLRKIMGVAFLLLSLRILFTAGTSAKGGPSEETGTTPSEEATPSAGQG